MGSPTAHDRALKLAALEERMNTHQAKYETTLERFGRELEKRDKENTRWIVGAIVAATIVILATVRLMD